MTDPDAFGFLAERLDHGAGAHVQAPAAEGPVKFGGDAGVGAEDEDRAGLEQGDGGPGPCG